MALSKQAPAAKKAAPAAKTAPAAKKAAPAAKSAAPAKKATGAAARPKPIMFKAPEDHKPAFFEIEFHTTRDGLPHGGSIKIDRVKGNWTNADAPRYDLSEYDVKTMLSVAVRLGAVAMAPNVLKRLPPKARFGLVVRVNKRAVDGTLSVLVKGAKQMVMVKDKPKWKWFEDKADLTYRRLRKLSRLLPGAFVEVQLPPSRRAAKKGAEE